MCCINFSAPRSKPKLAADPQLGLGKQGRLSELVLMRRSWKLSACFKGSFILRVA